ncbi:early boundary activity protein 1 [Drosophila sulfurigaster albostrigata]|uniref:early boundary activity protein 1 n=1 Tax=Drosophila sulfurigaster albostrigata TaxID=89887 RepID=UPI002D219C62|nr:early boundary activity protein 1 [Drosophila sulfurigaster albostrigata]
MSRRQRLEIALSILPYDHKLIKFSEAQKKVADLVAKCTNDEPCTAKGKVEKPKVKEMTSEEKARQQERQAAGFAELAMRHIEETDRETAPKPIKKQISTIATLAMAAEKLMETPPPEGKDEPMDTQTDNDPKKDVDVETYERRILEENTIAAVNAARVKMLQNWNKCKLTALELLTKEMDKLHDGERNLNVSLGRTPITPSTERAPETAEDDIIDQHDYDDDYVPSTKKTKKKPAVKRKRVKAKRRLASTSSSGSSNKPAFEFEKDPNSTHIVLGPQGTRLTRVFLDKVNWDNTGAAITRKLLTEIFDRMPLSDYTLSGKPSPAFKDCVMPVKAKLDPVRVADLVYFMTSCFDMTAREVRTAITTKCADETKMQRQRELREEIEKARKEAERLGIEFVPPQHLVVALKKLETQGAKKRRRRRTKKY